MSFTMNKMYYEYMNKEIDRESKICFALSIFKFKKIPADKQLGLFY